MDISVFGSSYTPADRALLRGRFARTTSSQAHASSLSPADVAAIRARVPNISSHAAARAAGGHGVLPRAIHALNARQEPSRQGAAVVAQARAGTLALAQSQLNGFGSLGATNPGCTSTGAVAAQATLAAGGSLLTGLSTTLGQPSASGTASLPSTPTAPNRALAISGAITSVASAIYTGVCQARTGTTPPAVTQAQQVTQATLGIIGDIRAAQGQQGAAVTPTAQDAAAAAATNANAAESAAATAATQAAAAQGNDKTMLYVGGGLAVALVGYLVLRR